MSFWHRTSRGYSDADDIEGAWNVLRKRIEAFPEYESTPYYMGAFMIVNFMRNHEDIRDQSVLMDLFDRQLEEQGIQPIPAIEKGVEIEED